MGIKIKIKKKDNNKKTSKTQIIFKLIYNLVVKCCICGTKNIFSGETFCLMFCEIIK